MSLIKPRTCYQRIPRTLLNHVQNLPQLKCYENAFPLISWGKERWRNIWFVEMEMLMKINLLSSNEVSPWKLSVPSTSRGCCVPLELENNRAAPFRSAFWNQAFISHLQVTSSMGPTFKWQNQWEQRCPALQKSAARGRQKQITRIKFQHPNHFQGSRRRNFF